MNNSVRFTLGLDASQVVSGEKVAMNAVNNIGKAMREAFGSKLKSIISFTAIEEATRRTAEWASEINQTGRALGMTAEELQALKLIAQESGTPADAATSMFENIKKAAEEALSGNGEMIASFQALGVELKRTDTGADVFSKTMAALGRGTVGSPNQFLRQSAARITGTPEQTVASFLGGYNARAGAGLEDKANRMAGANEIVGGGDIAQLAAQWAEIVSSFTRATAKLKPLAALILDAVTYVVHAFEDWAKGIHGVTDMVRGLFTGNRALMKSGYLAASDLINRATGITAANAIGTAVGLPSLSVAQSGAPPAPTHGHPTAPVNSQLLPQIPMFMHPAASGGGNLKIGGMFGAGEARIIKMTQRMIDLLGQIATNTAPWNGSAARAGSTGGNTIVQLQVHQAGGI